MQDSNMQINQQLQAVIKQIDLAFNDRVNRGREDRENRRKRNIMARNREMRKLAKMLDFDYVEMELDQ